MTAYPPMTDVESSTVKSVGYDVLEQTLFVEFHATGLYCYWNVPENVYIDLMAAESLGKFINHAIRGHYAYEKLPPRVVAD